MVRIDGEISEQLVLESSVNKYLFCPENIREEADEERIKMDWISDT